MSTFPPGPREFYNSRTWPGTDDEDEIEWKAKGWQNALKDIAAGTFKAPIIRVPVILTPKGPVSSAEGLQQLAQMQSVPETLDATIIQENGDQERYAIVVRSLKEGVTLSRDVGNGNGNGNAGRESKLVENQGLLADRREPEGL
ncbi:hypothetical protein P885DRAFT_64643 [Corynascus similis CBS 632.67]